MSEKNLNTSHVKVKLSPVCSSTTGSFRFKYISC